MAQQKYIPCDIFKRGVNIFIGTPEEFQKWVDYLFPEEEYASFRYSVRECDYGDGDTHFEDGTTIVRIGKFPETPAETAILAHELLHATDLVLSFCGVEWVKSTNNETYTYLLEWLMKNALTPEGYEKACLEEG